MIVCYVVYEAVMMVFEILPPMAVPAEVVINVASDIAPPIAPAIIVPGITDSNRFNYIRIYVVIR